MLGHLALAQHGTDLQTDRILAAQGVALTLHGGLDAGEILLGRRQQLAALAPALVGQIGVAAHDQPLAGEVG